MFWHEEYRKEAADLKEEASSLKSQLEEGRFEILRCESLFLQVSFLQALYCQCFLKLDELKHFGVMAYSLLHPIQIAFHMVTNSQELRGLLSKQMEILKGELQDSQPVEPLPQAEAKEEVEESMIVEEAASGLAELMLAMKDIGLGEHADLAEERSECCEKWKHQNSNISMVKQNITLQCRARQLRLRSSKLDASGGCRANSWVFMFNLFVTRSGARSRARSCFLKSSNSLKTSLRVSVSPRKNASVWRHV